MFSLNLFENLLLPGLFSPRIIPVMAVKIKVIEFVTGTAIDTSTFCNEKKYNTEPS